MSLVKSAFFPEHKPKRALLYIRGSRQEDGSIHGGSRAAKEVQRKRKKLYKARFVRPAGPKVNYAIS
jgi:hypothetical protein